ncbi:MAG TPA: (2Fe-2S)-binding protein [Syntrophorhabdaceae bacterium]|nr:(2Fe-2S)-binding protein [Syntrophorhabdaceae bacterium]
MAEKFITFKANGKEVTVAVKPGEMLADVLREKLGLTGTKIGCREGECGVCSVIMDGKLVLSCIIPAMKAHGTSIITIEGLEKNGELHTIQMKFVEKGAIQCGFCTPAMVLAGKVLLDENPKPTRDEIKTAISGILCRCTGYQKIIEAIQSASEEETR